MGRLSKSLQNVIITRSILSRPPQLAILQMLLLAHSEPAEHCRLTTFDMPAHQAQVLLPIAVIGGDGVGKEGLDAKEVGQTGRGLMEDVHHWNVNIEGEGLDRRT